MRGDRVSGFGLRASASIQIRVLVALALAACGDNKDVPALPLASGPAQLVLEDGALVFSRDGAVLLTFHAGAFQVGTVDDLDSGASFDPYWLFVDAATEPDGLAWHTSDALHVRASDASALTLAFDVPGGEATVTFRPGEDGCFRAVLASDAPQVAYLRVRPDADASEGFYGLGEWGDGIEHRGKLRPMQLEVDTTIESSNNENHVPVPLLVGTRGWGLFVASNRPGAFDVARETATLIDVTFGTAEDSARGLELHLFSAETALDIYKPYYEVAGYPGLPALWAYGPLLWRNENANQAQVLDDIQQIRTRDLATSGMWFDRPYATGVNTFDWNPAKFPAPETMLQAVHDAGLRYAIWQAPYVAPGDKQDPAPDNNAYAATHGFFPPVTGLLVNQWGKPIDFTNPEAYAWWKQNLSSYTLPLGSGGFGVEGFKLDYAEDIVLGASGSRIPWQFADGRDERTMHYGYTMLYHQIHRELLDANGGFLLTRAGRWGDQSRGVIIWPGDLDADLSKFGDPRPGESTRAVGGLPTALAFGLGLSASGFPFYASDTGGYRESPPNQETWLRWVEANAVWPVMQVGDASSQMPWEFTAANGRTLASVDTYRIYARLHIRLFPYAWTYAKQIAMTGRPIVRPWGLVPRPPSNVPVNHRADQYYFGDYVLVAPVITAGQTSREVLLDLGDWYDWWNGEHYGSEAVTVAAPLDKLPLFLKGGGIVPMLRNTIDTLAPTTMAGVESYANDPGILIVRTAPGADQPPFVMFDDTRIEVSYTTRALKFTPGTKFKQGVLFEVIGWRTAYGMTATPTGVTDASIGALTQRNSVMALESASEGWFFDAAATGGTLWIKVPAAAALTIQ
jgi:alpha-D-xyloside xylohydrolase